MPGWVLYVLVGLSVHLAALAGLPESGLLRLGERFGLGAEVASALAAMALLAVLHSLARAVERRGWQQGYFQGHFDGLRDAGAVWDDP